MAANTNRHLSGKGFHLDIKVGSTPVRRFTIHKDEKE